MLDVEFMAERALRLVEIREEGAAAVEDPFLRAAKAILMDCSDRRGIKWGFSDVDDDVMNGEILPTWAAIMKLVISPDPADDGGTT